MLPLQQAQKLVLDAIRPRPVRLPLEHCAGLILAEALVSPQASPLFDNSAMDGFALAGPFAEPPFQRRVCGSIAAGQVYDSALEPSTALRIMTGAQVPDSADAVVPIEQIRVEGETITVLASVRPGQHIRRQGEEFVAGDALLEPGTRLNPAAIGLLATVGVSQALVYAPPKVAILATGSELLPIAAPLQPGKLRDSNSQTLAAAVREAGGEPVSFGILPDEPEAIRRGLEAAFASCDLVLTSGGVSVGDYDYVQDILIEMGLERLFWKVAIKPGKPVLVGRLNEKMLFGIPGNPASALTVFEVLVRPALRKWLGDAELFRPEREALLAEPVKAAPDRLLLLRGSYAEGRFAPLRGQRSANLLSVARANAMLAVQRDYAAGEAVTICLTEARP